MALVVTAVYGEPVTIAVAGRRRSRRGGRRVVAGLVSPVWAGRTWRANAHVLAGAALGLLAAFVLVVLPGSLVLSLGSELLDVPDDHRWDTIYYVLLTLTSPWWLLWLVLLLDAAHRARFAGLLGVRLEPVGETSVWRVGRSWRTSATWRRLGYHLTTLVTGPVGAALAAGCWVGGVAMALATRSVYPMLAVLPLLLAAPWVTRGVAGFDSWLAARLLGPSASVVLARRVASLTRSRAEIVEATDAERRRIERDLHDGAQQRLVSLAMNLGRARAKSAGAPEELRQAIADAHDEAKQALVELRDLVRGLHPAVLNDRGLDAALSGLAARSPVPVRLRVDVASRCGPTIEAVAYFVVSEALTNVAKHAAATRAEVAVARTGDRLRIVVTDDGRGGAAAPPGSAAGTGLRGLAQRAAAVDGTLTIVSPPGGPTTITAELPCES